MPRRRGKRVSYPPEEVLVSELNHDGAGVVSVKGKKIFVQGALPNERVLFTRCSQHSQHDEGQVLKILDPSPDRVEAKCPHFLQCAGCALQHMSPIVQLHTKSEILMGHLKKMAGVVLDQFESTILSAKQYGYRRKARFGVRYVAKKGKVLVGFRERNGRYLCDMQTCEVLHPSLGRRLDDLSDLIGHLISYQSIPQVEMVRGDNGLAWLFRHLMPLLDSDIALLRDFGKNENIHIYLQSGGDESVRMIWPDSISPKSMNPASMASESGHALLHYAHKDHGFFIGFHPKHFIQVNQDVNQKMVTQAIEWLKIEAKDRLLDLFAGVGNFALPVAKYAKEVVALELCEKMVTQISANAAENNLSNVSAYAHNLLEPGKPDALSGSFSAVVLNPPHSGAEVCMAWLLAMKPKRILYVSCHALSFSKDAGSLIGGGYSLIKCGLIDMLPHTSHIESMALFEC